MLELEPYEACLKATVHLTYSWCYIFGNWIGKNKRTCVNMPTYVDIFH